MITRKSVKIKSDFAEQLVLILLPFLVFMAMFSIEGTATKLTHIAFDVAAFSCHYSFSHTQLLHLANVCVCSLPIDYCLCPVEQTEKSLQRNFRERMSTEMCYGHVESATTRLFSPD